MKDVRVKLGDNAFPQAGASGGSTTVGGVSAATRKATLNVLEKLFDAVARSLGTTPDQLVASDGKIMVKGDSSKSLTWKEACPKLGVSPIQESGSNNQRSPGGVISGGVGGAQIADVSSTSKRASSA